MLLIFRMVIGTLQNLMSIGKNAMSRVDNEVNNEISTYIFGECLRIK